MSPTNPTQDFGRSDKSFWLARRSDGHRFEGSRIRARSLEHAEAVYRRMRYNLDGADLMIVGARP